MIRSCTLRTFSSYQALERPDLRVGDFILGSGPSRSGEAAGVVLMMGAGRAARAGLPLARPRTGGVPRLLALRLKLPLLWCKASCCSGVRSAGRPAWPPAGARGPADPPTAAAAAVVVPHALSRVPVPSRLARDRYLSLALTVGET